MSTVLQDPVLKSDSLTPFPTLFPLCMDRNRHVSVYMYIFFS